MFAAIRTITQFARRTSISSAVVALALVSAAACGGDSKSTTGPSGDLGKYNLSAVQGHGLPATVFDEQVQSQQGQVFELKIVAKSGSIELKSGGVFVATMSLDIYADGALQSQHGGSFQGTWEKDSNNDIQFTSDPNDGIGDFFAHLSGNQITTQLDLSGTNTLATFTFKK